MRRRPDLAEIEHAARQHGQIALLLNEDGAEYYIELLNAEAHRDSGAREDENYLRQQAARMWPDKEWL